MKKTLDSGIKKLTTFLKSLNVRITGSVFAAFLAVFFFSSSVNAQFQCVGCLVGVEEGSSTIADVNGDENPDVLITGHSRATMYLGDGGGGFTPADASLLGVRRSSSSIADVNGDGNPDILITGKKTSGVTSLYLGDGTGSFEAADDNLTDVYWGSSSIADVNGDENMDILLTGITNGSATATIFLGDGSGSFSSADANLTGVFRSSTSIDDVNNDGNQDLLITGEDSENLPKSFLYLGEGEGGFTKAGADLNGVTHSSSSVGDLDNDGNPDLLITGKNYLGVESSTLYFGDGTGSFSSADSVLTGILRGSSSISDVNDDGNLDLLLTGEGPNFNKIATLYLGNGSGEFSSADVNLTGVENSSSSIADINKDGKSDILITGLDSNETMTAEIYLGEDFKTLGSGLTDLGSNTSSVGDVDNDGNSDIFLAGSPSNGDRITSMYLGDGQGSFTDTEASLLVLDDASAIGDVNNDGNQDLLLAGTDSDFTEQTKLYLSDGSGGFNSAGADLHGVTSSSLSMGDVDDDGNMDIVVTGQGRYAYNETSATLYWGDGTGSFTEAETSLRSVAHGSSTIADLDGDGNLDILITGLDEGDATHAELYFGDGMGNFTNVAGHEAGLTGVTASSSSVSDINGDGNPDILITGVTEIVDSETYNPRTTTLYLGDGSRSFTEAEAGLTNIANGSSAIEDFNNDGAPDILINGRDSVRKPTTNLYLGDGQGNYTTADVNLVDIDGSFSVIDVNGDNKKDLIMSGTLPVSGNMKASWVYKNQGNITTNIATPSESPDDYHLASNFPNPFNPNTRIKFSLPKNNHVQLEVFDVIGRKVATLVDQRMQAGSHTVSFNASNLSSGVYIYRITAGEYRESRKMMLVK